MNPARDERFLELAMKLIARECSAAEKAELKQMLAEEPELQAQLTKLCASAVIAREVLPLVSAMEATEGEMTAGEMAAFRMQVGRVRRSSQKEPTPPLTEDYPSLANDGNGSGGGQIIEAEIVPEKPFNTYKLCFYALVLLVLIAGSVFLLKSCRTPEKAARVDPSPAAPARSNAVVKPAEIPAEPAARPVEHLPQPTSPVERNKEPVEAAPPAIKSLLPTYKGAQWVKVFDGNSKPGFSLMFRQFVPSEGASLMIEGMIGPNGKFPTGLMVLRNQGKGWETHSFPGLPSDPDLVEGVGAERLAFSYRTLPSEIYLIEGARARKLASLGPLTCTAVHAVSADRFFLHCYEGSAFEVNGSKVTRLLETDAATYVYYDGHPTSMLRGGIHSIAKADTGETMGIFWRRPSSLGSAALVRFNGSVWEYVCSLGRDYLETRTHFLTKDTMVGAMDNRVVIVKGGQPEMMGVPSEFEAAQTAKFMAVRAASTEDFVLVDNYGGVYRYLNGKYQQPVGPMTAFQGAEILGFRSVMIAADGAIYGIQGLNQWTSSIIYKLAPK